MMELWHNLWDERRNSVRNFLSQSAKLGFKCVPFMRVWGSLESYNSHLDHPMNAVLFVRLLLINASLYSPARVSSAVSHSGRWDPLLCHRWKPSQPPPLIPELSTNSQFRGMKVDFLMHHVTSVQVLYQNSFSLQMVKLPVLSINL